jgi:hypothetical protein
MVSHTIRTRATCLHVSNAARIRTTLILCPDGDPTVSINTTTRRILSLPHKIFLLAACELVGFKFFGFLHIPLIFQNHVCRQSTPQGPSEACGR